MNKQKAVALIVEYVRNDDAMEEDFIATLAAINSVDTSKLKPTSTVNRLLINTDLYMKAEPGAETRKFYRKMVEEVKLIEAGV